MTSISITLSLPERLAAEARAAGLLDEDRMAALLERELARQDAWERLNQAAGVVRQSALADYADLSDEEVMRLVSEEIEIMRNEARAQADHEADDRT